MVIGISTPIRVPRRTDFWLKGEFNFQVEQFIMAGQGANAALGFGPAGPSNEFQSAPTLLSANTAAYRATVAFSLTFRSSISNHKEEQPCQKLVR